MKMEIMGLKTKAKKMRMKEKIELKDSINMR